MTTNDKWRTTTHLKLTCAGYIHGEYVRHGKELGIVEALRKDMDAREFGNWNTQISFKDCSSPQEDRTQFAVTLELDVSSYQLSVRSISRFLGSVFQESLENCVPWLGVLAQRGGSPSWPSRWICRFFMSWWLLIFTNHISIISHLMVSNPLLSFNIFIVLPCITPPLTQSYPIDG